MKNLFKVYEEDNDYYFDVIGASTAEDAARVYVASVKRDQLEEIEYCKKLYAEEKAEGRLEDVSSFEKSPMFEELHLPAVVTVIPMVDISGFHDRQISDERKYMAEAFESLWDHDRKVEVRL